MGWVILAPLSLIAFSILGMIHFHGYKKGHKDGFKLGARKINEYLRGVNESQGERIKELNSQRSDQINEIAEFLTKKQ